jgi:hypothetical protein
MGATLWTHPPADGSFLVLFSKKERLALRTFAVAQAVADAGFGGDDGGELGAEFAAELADIDA